jgi:hypothetical protein
MRARNQRLPPGQGRRRGGLDGSDRPFDAVTGGRRVVDLLLGVVGQEVGSTRRRGGQQAQPVRSASAAAVRMRSHRSFSPRPDRFA